MNTIDYAATPPQPLSLAALAEAARQLESSRAPQYKFAAHPDDVAAMPRMSSDRARICGFPLQVNRACPPGFLLAFDHEGKLVGKVNLETLK